MPQTDAGLYNPRYRRLRAHLLGWRGHLLALVAGALPTLSLAPFDAWWAGVLAVALLLALVDRTALRVALLRSWLFGVGLFGSGTSWIYVSISQHGGAAPPLAGLLVVLFTLALATLPMLGGWLYYHCARHSRGLAFAASWVALEWIRSWLLSGFPWLLLGYAHVDTLLAGWAPVVGVFGLSFIVAISGAACYELLSGRGWRRGQLAAVAALLWLAGGALQYIEWTAPSGRPVEVALVQPDIPQHIKWRPAAFDNIIRRYLRLSDAAWNADIVVWPEAAIPRKFHDIAALAEQLEGLAGDHGATLITGVPFRERDAGSPTGIARYNALIALGDGEGVYFKQRLVPFGEYVPLERWLRGLIAFFDLPMSHMSRGPAGQQNIRAGQWQLAPFICYEIVYADLVARDAASSDLLLNISNDSWFGRSIGPLQHFQMTRMRALENGRPLLRGTNNGVTALVDHRGRVVARTAQFSQAVVRGTLMPRQGRTPFSRTGSGVVVALCLLALLGSRYRPSRWRLPAAELDSGV